MSISSLKSLLGAQIRYEILFQLNEMTLCITLKIEYHEKFRPNAKPRTVRYSMSRF